MEYRDFELSYWAKPIPMRDFDWQAMHRNFDGAPDSNNTKSPVFCGKTIQDVKRQVDEWYEEEEPLLNEMELLIMNVGVDAALRSVLDDFAKVCRRIAARLRKTEPELADLWVFAAEDVEAAELFHGNVLGL